MNNRWQSTWGTHGGCFKTDQTPPVQLSGLLHGYEGPWILYLTFLVEVDYLPMSVISVNRATLTTVTADVVEEMCAQEYQGNQN